MTEKEPKTVKRVDLMGGLLPKELGMSQHKDTVTEEELRERLHNLLLEYSDVKSVPILTESKGGVMTEVEKLADLICEVNTDCHLSDVTKTMENRFIRQAQVIIKCLPELGYIKKPELTLVSKLLISERAKDCVDAPYSSIKEMMEWLAQAQLDYDKERMEVKE